MNCISESYIYCILNIFCYLCSKTTPACLNKAINRTINYLGLLYKGLKILIVRRKGSVSEFTERRNRDLYAQYCALVKRQLQLYGRVNKAALLKQVVNMPASRYWLSPERGYSIVTKIKRGELTTPLTRNKRLLYMALFEEYMVYKEHHPNTPDSHIMGIITEHPAPCFGLEPRVAGFIIKKMEAICKQEKLRRLKALSLHCS